MIVQKATREIVLLRRLPISTAAFYVSSRAGSIEKQDSSAATPPRAAKWFRAHLFHSYVFLSDKVILL